MSPNFVHFMYLIFEPILLMRKFWGITRLGYDSLRRNEYNSIPLKFDQILRILMRSAALSSQSLMYLVSRHNFRNVLFVLLSKETQLVQEHKKGTNFVTLVQNLGQIDIKCYQKLLEYFFPKTNIFKFVFAVAEERFNLIPIVLFQ